MSYCSGAFFAVAMLDQDLCHCVLLDIHDFSLDIRLENKMHPSMNEVGDNRSYHRNHYAFLVHTHTITKGNADRTKKKQEDHFLQNLLSQNYDINQANYDIERLKTILVYFL